MQNGDINDVQNTKFRDFPLIVCSKKNLLKVTNRDESIHVTLGTLLPSTKLWHTSDCVPPSQSRYLHTLLHWQR